MFCRSFGFLLHHHSTRVDRICDGLMLSQCACVHSVGCGGGVGGAHGHPGCTRALLNHCCAHCGPPSHAIALLWSCTLSFVVYFLLSSGIRSTEGVSPSMAPLTHSPWSPLSDLRETPHSRSMGPISHALWDPFLTQHGPSLTHYGTPLSPSMGPPRLTHTYSCSPSYYTPPSLTLYPPLHPPLHPPPYPPLRFPTTGSPPLTRPPQGAPSYPPLT